MAHDNATNNPENIAKIVYSAFGALSSFISTWDVSRKYFPYLYEKGKNYFSGKNENIESGKVEPNSSENISKIKSSRKLDEIHIESIKNSNADIGDSKKQNSFADNIKKHNAVISELDLQEAGPSKWDLSQNEVDSSQKENKNIENKKEDMQELAR